jgi:hypothetical protein
MSQYHLNEEKDSEVYTNDSVLQINV